MVTQADIAKHGRAVSAIVNLAIRDLTTVWRTLTFDDARRAEREIRALLPLLIDAYETPMAALSAEWYDELREKARATGRYTAQPGYGPGIERLNSLAGYSANALYGADIDDALALSRLTGGLQRILTDIDRDTIAGNTVLDPTRVRYARHARANACAFCAMLATRGAVYLDKASASVVVGRGTEKRHDGTRMDARRLGIRARGKRPLGEKYHDFCRCTGVPVFEGEDYEEAPYVQKFREAYLAAEHSTTPGPQLAEMRKYLDTK